MIGLARALRATALPRVAAPYTASETVAYAPARPGIAPLADIYLPARATGASVVLVHGGGFVFGSRGMTSMRWLGAELAAAGIAGFAIDYRMWLRGGRSRTIEHALDDVIAACAAWRQLAGEHGRVISLVGLSAGGTLALLAARPERAIDRVVACFGLYDVDHLTGPAALYRRLVIGDRALPCHADPPAVPTLLLHGGADELVPVSQAHRLAARRHALGLPTRLVTYPDAPHGFFNYDHPAARLALGEICGFVRKQT